MPDNADSGVIDKEIVLYSLKYFLVIMKTLSKFKLITLKYFTIKSEKMKSFNFLFLIILTHLLALFTLRPIEIKNSQCIKNNKLYKVIKETV